MYRSICSYQSTHSYSYYEKNALSIKVYDSISELKVKKRLLPYHYNGVQPNTGDHYLYVWRMKKEGHLQSQQIKNWMFLMDIHTRG